MANNNASENICATKMHENIQATLIIQELRATTMRTRI